VSLVDETSYFPSQEPSATVEKGNCREAALASVLEGSEDEPLLFTPCIRAKDIT